MNRLKWRRLAMEDHPQTAGESLLAAVLRGASLIYRFFSGLNHRLYDWRLLRGRELDLPVISVGNLTVGGTGKTPFILYLCEKLVHLRKKPAVLTRGYGGPQKVYDLIQSPEGNITGSLKDMDIDKAADEPRLLAMNCPNVPVMVNPDRFAGGVNAAERYDANVVLLDDGFQHRRLARSLDIVLVDAAMPVEGWALLPRGLMREPIRALKRAHAVCITRADMHPDRAQALKESLQHRFPHLVTAMARHRFTDFLHPGSQLTETLDAHLNDRIGIVSSLAAPEIFEEAVKSEGFRVQWHCAFEDHHQFLPDDFQLIADTNAQQGVDYLVTTEKDWMRLAPLADKGRIAGIPVLVLRMRMEFIQGEEDLHARLCSVLVG